MLENCWRRVFVSVFSVDGIWNDGNDTFADSRGLEKGGSDVGGFLWDRKLSYVYIFGIHFGMFVP